MIPDQIQDPKLYESLLPGRILENRSFVNLTALSPQLPPGALAHRVHSQPQELQDKQFEHNTYKLSSRVPISRFQVHWAPAFMFKVQSTTLNPEPHKIPEPSRALHPHVVLNRPRSLSASIQGVPDIGNLAGIYP